MFIDLVVFALRYLGGLVCLVDRRSPVAGTGLIFMVSVEFSMSSNWAEWCLSFRGM